MSNPLNDPFGGTGFKGWTNLSVSAYPQYTNPLTDDTEQAVWLSGGFSYTCACYGDFTSVDVVLIDADGDEDVLATLTPEDNDGRLYAPYTGYYTLRPTGATNLKATFQLNR